MILGSYFCASSSSPVDDGSISSTMDVSQMTRPIKKGTGFDPKSKCVSFQENANICYSSPFQDKCESLHLWYTADDYQQFKTDYVDAMKMALGEDARDEKSKKYGTPSFIAVMDLLYEHCCTLSKTSAADDIIDEAEENDFPDDLLGQRSADDVMDSDDDLDLLQDLLEQQRLRNLLMLYSVNHQDLDGVDGLEKALVRRIRFDKKWRRQKLIHALLEIQENNNSNNVYDHDTNDTTAQTMALVAQGISKPSRLFARQIAMVAEASVKRSRTLPMEKTYVLVQRDVGMCQSP